MPLFKRLKLNQRGLPRFRLGEAGVIHLLPLFVLLAGIIAGVYLVQKNGFQIFKPKATAENITFERGQCLAIKDGKKVLTCGVVNLRLISPLDAGQTSDAGSNFSPLAKMSLVKTAYAAWDGTGDQNGIGGACGDDPSKLYEEVGGFLNIGTHKQEISTCNPEYSCTILHTGIVQNTNFQKAYCSRNGIPLVSGNGWRCQHASDNIGFGRTAGREAIHRDGFAVLTANFGELNIDCPENTVCSEEGGTLTCVPNGQGSASAQNQPNPPTANNDSNTPIIFFPKGTPQDNNDGKIHFSWSNVSKARSYRLGIRNISGNDTLYNTKDSFYALSLSDFDDGRTYVWWVSALGDDGLILENGASPLTQFTVHKTTGAISSPVPANQPSKYSCEGENTLVVQKSDSTVKLDCTRGGEVKSKCGHINGSTYEAQCIDVGVSDAAPFAPSAPVGSAPAGTLARGNLSTVGTPTGQTPGAVIAPDTQANRTCKNETKTWAQLDSELRNAGYNGAFNHSASELEAYNNAACPKAPADCLSFTRPAPGTGNTPEGGKWVPVDGPYGKCTLACRKNSDCPVSTDPSIAGDPGMYLKTAANPEGAINKTNWCYGFSQPRCLMLMKSNSPAAPATGASGGQNPTPAPVPDTQYSHPHSGSRQKVTTGYRISETPLDNVTAATLPFQRYYRDIAVSYILNDSRPGQKFIYVQFQDNEGHITNANPYPAQIELVNSAAGSPATPTPQPGAARPARPECPGAGSSELKTTCGTQTYDTCVDQNGITNDKSNFCSDATAKFRCWYSKNDACRSSASDTIFNYSCSACSGNGSPARVACAKPGASGTKTTCGITTYDNCVDNANQTGTQLCSGTATKFKCVYSKNDNCISGRDVNDYNYSCDLCKSPPDQGNNE